MTRSDWGSWDQSTNGYPGEKVPVPGSKPPPEPSWWGWLITIIVVGALFWAAIGQHL